MMFFEPLPRRTKKVPKIDAMMHPAAISSGSIIIASAPSPAAPKKIEASTMVATTVTA